jgi:hypothetical protein
MSATLLMTACLAVPPPPPPQETELDSLEAEANEPEVPAPPTVEAESPDPVAPAPVESDDTSAMSPGEPAEPPPPAEIIYDEHGDPVVPYGEAAREEDELPFAEHPELQEELPYAESPAPEENGADLDYAERPPRSTMSRAALERQASIDLDGGSPYGGASPQRFAIELKFGPYIPSVDDPIDSNGFGPYTAIFGEINDTGVAVGPPKQGIFSVISFEWQFANYGGPLSLGTQVGYFRDKADGILTESSDGSIRSRADQVTFNVVPLAVLLGYRFEMLADRWRVPFVPYARGGLAYGIWWSKDGSGEVSTNNAGVKGRGGSLGWQANLGMMLQLDFIDRGSAKALDQTTGINHTYVFGEYQLSRLDGFGSGKRMSVGDDTYMVGLAVEF